MIAARTWPSVCKATLAVVEDEFSVLGHARSEIRHALTHLADDVLIDVLTHLWSAHVLTSLRVRVAGEARTALAVAVGAEFCRGVRAGSR